MDYKFLYRKNIFFLCFTKRNCLQDGAASCVKGVGILIEGNGSIEDATNFLEQRSYYWLKTIRMLIRTIPWLEGVDTSNLFYQYAWIMVVDHGGHDRESSS